VIPNAELRSDSFQAFVERARAAIDTALERYLPAPPDCPPLVSDAMRYSLFAGGKRLRPILTLASADAVGKQGYDPLLEALPAACAIEMIHTYSLIHDDLPAMDNDALRRGRPTLHVVYGDGVAVLAGDGLQAEAFALLAREPRTDDPDLIARKLRVVHLVAAAAGVTGMVGGQAIDLQAAGQAPGHALTLDGDGLRGMHLRKTGALIRAAAESGAVMGGGDDAAAGAVGRWATQIGLAFQIVDDILDVEGASSELGKTVGKDAASGKPTYVSLFGLHNARAMATECGDRARTILEDAGLAHNWLGPIADWILQRKS
jgi:geranylgeranyl diphosphate synthase type II